MAEPFLTAFADGAPIFRGADLKLQRHIAGLPHATVRGAGHFVQEDRGEALARNRRALRRVHAARMTCPKWQPASDKT